MSGLLRGLASLLIGWALVCPVFAQSDPLSVKFGQPVIPPPDPPADQRCQQHSVEISGIRCFSRSLHKSINVTEQCAQWAKEMNIDPLFCSPPGPRATKFISPSQSDAVPEGGLPGPIPAPKSNPYPPPPVDLTALANLADWIAKRKTATEKTTSEVKAPATPTPEKGLQPPDGSVPSYVTAARLYRQRQLQHLEPTRDPELGHLNEWDIQHQLANITRDLAQTREDNEKTREDNENLRREGAKRDNKDNAFWAMTTGGSLWYTRNRATENSTLTFIKVVTNNSEIAAKLAPPLFRILKSKPTGAILLVTIGAGATYYLYELFGFDKSVEPVAVIHNGAVSALPKQ
jgi:hypothetical protein